MATILQTKYSNAFSWRKSVVDIFINISLNHISKGAIENKHWSMKWFEQCYDAVYLIIRPKYEDFVARSRYLRQG